MYSCHFLVKRFNESKYTGQLQLQTSSFTVFCWFNPALYFVLAYEYVKTMS